jgi:DNA-binding CsgD family transcriptional regulator
MVVKGADGRRLSVLVAPLRRDDCSYGPTDASAVVFANASRSRTPSAAATVGKLYRLTPAEKRLLEALLQGERIAGYANRVGISTNTANTQLKQIFAKTGTSRQSELMRQISSDPVASLVS